MSFILFNFFTKLNPSLHTILYFCFFKKHVLDNFPCRYRFMSLFNSWVILHFTHGSKFIWSIIYYDADKLFFAIFRLINQDLRNTLVISPIISYGEIPRIEFNLHQRIFSFGILIHAAKLFSGKNVPIFTLTNSIWDFR